MGGDVTAVLGAKASRRIPANAFLATTAAIKTIGCSCILLACAVSAAAQTFTVGPTPNQTFGVGQSVSLTITTSGGTATVSCILASNSQPLPAGLKLTGCLIIGTPTTPGTSTITIDAISGAQTASETFTITVNAGTTPPPQNFKVNLPHWAAFGGWLTDWSIVNVWGEANPCTLYIYGPSGQPLSVGTSIGTGSTLSFSIALNGTAEITAGGGGGTLLTGSSNVTCVYPVYAKLIYTFLDASGEALTAVSVLPSSPFTTFVFEANALTGIALENIGSETVTVSITAFDTTGKIVGAGTRMVQFGKLVFNLNQVITLDPSFFGSVKIVASLATVKAAVVGVQAGAAGGFVLDGEPPLAFNAQPSFACLFNFLAGSLKGVSGTVEINSPVAYGNGAAGAAYYWATAITGSSTGTALLISHDGNMFLEFGTGLSQLSGAAAALTTSTSGPLTGAVSVQSNTGTITCNPVGSATTP